MDLSKYKDKLTDSKNTENPSKDGVTLAAFKDNDVTIYYNPVEYNAQNPVKTMYIKIGDEVIAKVDFPEEYLGQTIILEYDGKHYKGKFTESAYANPTVFELVEKE